MQSSIVIGMTNISVPLLADLTHGVGGLSTSVLCGTTNEEHMRQTVAAVLGSEELEDGEMDAIRHVMYGE